MKKILFLITVLMLSLTPLISQTTTTLTADIHNFIISNESMLDISQSDKTYFFVSGGSAGIPISTVVSNTYTFQGSYSNITAVLSVSSHSYGTTIQKQFTINGVNANTSSTYSISGSGNQITITFTITGNSGSYYIELSNLVITGTNNSTTGIRESLDLNKTNVWVHSNKIYFKNLDDKQIKMNVFNISGQLVLEDNSPKPETEVDFANGVYIIQLVEGDKVIHNRKVIIMQ